MRNQQFAIRPTQPATALRELERIHFLTAANQKLTSVSALLRDFYDKSWPEYLTVEGVDRQLANLMATPDVDGLDFLSHHENVPVTVFYNLALQRLGFTPDLDFNLADPLTAMAKIQLPVADHATDELTLAELKQAWYLLLTTHTKDGQTFLDHLTTHGYFAPLVHDPSVEKPLIFNGKAQAVFDTTRLIREVVYVESPQDTDGDGHRDLLKAEVIRPAETENGLKVPVLYTASPYNQGTNDEAGDQMMHNVNVPLEPKQPNDRTLADVTAQPQSMAVPEPRSVMTTTKTAEETFAREQSYTLNDYFLARGFAVVYAAGIGTLDSDGVRTTGDPEETTSTIAIIEWLAGNRTAFTSPAAAQAIPAWWSNHAVAMTGRSYLGTLATAAATTGVAGLKTVISEAAISNWYDYYRDGGLVVAPGGFPGEDADVLAEETFSRQLKAGDYHRIQAKWQADLAAITQGQDRASGNYNRFWDARNYLKNVKNIKADLLLVHGLNDWNVKPRNVNNLWNAVRDLPVTKKLILHQGQHIYINAFRSIDYTDIVNLWLTHELLGVDNQAESLLPNVIIQDNIQPETWHATDDWDAPTNAKRVFNLQHDELVDQATHEPLEFATSFNDQLPAAQYQRYTKDIAGWEADLLGQKHNDMFGHRLIFKSAVLKDDLILDGKPVIKLQVAVNQPMGMLSFQVVDYGQAQRLGVSPTPLRISLDEGYRWREDSLREFKLAKATPWKMITKGHRNLQNRTNAYQVDELKPNQFYNLSVTLQPTHYRLLAGHQLGLVVYATDFGMTVRGNQDLQYSVQLGASALTIPFVEA
ncbi:Xaa-Pro dipeptidyl-peptidase [Levilactobacillus tujiorum]|uniref:Xaa-Pro dipeptidyl-peptidase n=1 Tax=Levilactobacillus tujiorum TaxID=2912243 RepID=A0ABX1L8C8_9LACO|nr:Xaa-Pro dipeptidyl-peptidase [Levilactobacillus tujiorum]MCH5465125.1 Xaa-Pro dipeptidyl-peptidase [Levilactobacillus tujiorum]NLR12405.1 Xaa-Pro dipeptidyl-peptidase [Lactobacillus sp. HBUAS51387]NLR30142.1 Xaa-Pro dipeptidyl-peptidase [Levilactobacillus tujiorum]